MLPRKKITCCQEINNFPEIIQGKSREVVHFETDYNKGLESVETKR